MDALALGKHGERIAEDYLKEKGYKIVARNWRPKHWGEIDLVTTDGDTLVFVEVKTLRSDRFIKPFQKVDFHKLRLLKRSGEQFKLLHPNLPDAMRIDVVSIELDGKSRCKKVEVFVGVPST